MTAPQPMTKSEEIKFDKLRASRMVRGAIFALVGAVTSPAIADLITFGDNSIIKPIWIAGFSAFASWLTSTVSKRFGTPSDTLLLKNPTYTRYTGDQAG